MRNLEIQFYTFVIAMCFFCCVATWRIVTLELIVGYQQTTIQYMLEYFEAEEAKQDQESEMFIINERMRERVDSMACRMDILTAASRASWKQAHILLRSGAIESCAPASVSPVEVTAD